MGRNNGSAMDMFYNTGLFGPRSGFNRNPGAARERMIQQNIERNLCELAVNRFKWENLPPEMDARFIEISLLMNGLVVFYEDREVDKLIAAKGSATGYINFMDWPVAYQVFGPSTKISAASSNPASHTYQSKTISGFIPTTSRSEKDKELAFPVWPNYFRQSEMDTILIYSSRLATLDRTLEINTRNARRNKIITASPNTQLSMVNLAKQQDEGVELIQVKDSQYAQEITTLDLGILPDSYEKLSILRTRWWNECMGLLGIDNANQDKKERLVSDEVGANDSQTDSMRYVALNARRDGVAYINEVFGTNIKVDYNVEVEAMAKAKAIDLGIDDNESNNSDEEEAK